MTAYVSLFRAINVGGRQVKMEELKALHQTLGLRDVKTYIQSGNVVFQGDDEDTTQLQRRIAEAFARQWGFQSEVVVRTEEELRALDERNPFVGQAGRENNWIVVMFLTEAPDAEAEERLRQAYKGPEEYTLSGRELFIYYPEGIGRSKLSNSFIEKKIKVAGTARNWNTVLKLQAIFLA
jgi:uncharacterized protein (DUF1697 family)